MSLTESTMMPLGTQAPDFSLLDTVSGKFLSLGDLKSNKATVVMFICNHCPYVIHIQDNLVEIAREYQNKGLNFIAISSNDVSAHPDDSPDNMKKRAEELGYCFPYLYDETQAVAKAYFAACTPDFYIFDQNLLCRYRGRFDDSSPGNGKPITGKDLTTALDNILAAQPVDAEQFPSMGCNIKWKVSVQD